MNLVRLGMIVALAVVAWYALSIYAAIPDASVVMEPVRREQTVTVMCPAVNRGSSGGGAILVALVAIGGALSVSAVDLARRVY